MNIQKLHAETVKARALIDALSEQFSEEELAEILPDTIEGETDFYEALSKLDAQVALDEARVDGLTSKITELANRQARFSRRISKSQQAILAAMRVVGVKKAELALSTISVLPARQHVSITDEDAVPGEYRNNPTPPAPNKTRIKEALRSGTEVPGCHLEWGNPSLKISRK